MLHCMYIKGKGFFYVYQPENDLKPCRQFDQGEDDKSILVKMLARVSS